MKKRGITRQTWEEVKREKALARQRGYGLRFPNAELVDKAVFIAEQLLKHKFVLSVGLFGSTARGEDGADVDLLIVDDGTVSMRALHDAEGSLALDSYETYAQACYLAFADHMPGRSLLAKLGCDFYEYIRKTPYALDLIFVNDRIRRDQRYLDRLLALMQSDPFFFRNIGNDTLLFVPEEQTFCKGTAFPGFINNGLPSQEVLRRIQDEMSGRHAVNTAKGVRGQVAEAVGFEAIGGQFKAKTEVMNLSAALNNPERYQRWGTKPPRGVCLWGPPGTGKTLLAKALATETCVPFYLVDASQIVSKWYGEAEKNVDETFVKARETGGILFFDEADSLASSRDALGAHEASKRVVAALNRNMDGFQTSDRVVVFFATNRLEDMDTAVLRPGRIDRIIEVPLPDREGRREILEVHLRAARKRAGRELFQDLDIESILEKTEGYSGADLAEIVRRTLEARVREEDEGGSPGLVSTEDILKEIGSYERVKKSRHGIGFGQE